MKKRNGSNNGKSMMLAVSVIGCSSGRFQMIVTITQYKDLEVPQAASTEITEEKVTNVIQSNLELAAEKRRSQTVPHRMVIQ